MTTTTNMNKIALFHDFNLNSDVTNKSVAQLKTFLNNVSFGSHKMVTTGADVKLFDIHEGHGELLSNVDTLNTKCHGLSIWATVKDIGVRLTQEYYEEFKKAPACDLLMNVKGYTLKGRKNPELRFTFESIESTCRFLYSLFTYYNAYQQKSATKLIESVESVIA